MFSDFHQEVQYKVQWERKYSSIWWW